MPGMEIPPMQIQPPLAPQAQPKERCPDQICPIEVWTTLTPTQQHSLLQTLVRMCQDCLLPGKETAHDPACPLGSKSRQPILNAKPSFTSGNRRPSKFDSIPRASATNGR